MQHPKLTRRGRGVFRTGPWPRRGNDVARTASQVSSVLTALINDQLL